MEEKASEIVQMLQSNPGMLSQVLAGMANSRVLDMAVPGAVREEEVPAQPELSGGPLSESESVSESDKPSVSDGQSHQSSSETSDASSDDEAPARTDATSKQVAGPNVPSVSKSADDEQLKSSRAGITESKYKNLSAEELFRKRSKGRLDLMHTMRNAAKEAKLYGVKTLKQASVRERNWLFKRAYKSYPALRAHERDVHSLVRRMLINAKHTQGRTKSQKSEKPCSKTSPKKEAAKTLHKAFRKAKSSPHKQRKDMIRHAISEVKNVLKAKKSLNLDIKAQDQWPTPGEMVRVWHSNKEVIASATFMSKVNEMYARVRFIQHEGTTDIEIDLPEPVPKNKYLGRGEKLLFNQLEIGDQFLWKIEKLLSQETQTKAQAKTNRSSDRAKTRTDRLVGHL